MATWEDVRRLALALPETSERLSWGTPSWQVRDKAFVWDRPLRPRDLEELGAAAPAGPVLGARVADPGAKEALCAEPSGVYFTTSHFDGYLAVLVVLEEIAADELEELIVEAWLARAPPTLARAWAAEHPAAAGRG